MIDTSWRPDVRWWRATESDGKFRQGQESGASVVLQLLNEGYIPPGLEDIPAVVEAVKKRHNLVELANDQTPPMYHSDYRDKDLYELICKALHDAEFRKVKL